MRKWRVLAALALVAAGLAACGPSVPEGYVHEKRYSPEIWYVTTHCTGGMNGVPMTCTPQNNYLPPSWEVKVCLEQVGSLADAGKGFTCEWHWLDEAAYAAAQVGARWARS